MTKFQKGFFGMSCLLVLGKRMFFLVHLITLSGRFVILGLFVFGYAGYFFQIADISNDLLFYWESHETVYSPEYQTHVCNLLKKLDDKFVEIRNKKLKPLASAASPSMNSPQLTHSNRPNPAGTNLNSNPAALAVNVSQNAQRMSNPINIEAKRPRLD